MDIFTTDYQRHTAEMVVVESLWQLHTLIRERGSVLYLGVLQVTNTGMRRPGY